MSGIWGEYALSPLRWTKGELRASVSRAGLRSDRHSQHKVVSVRGMLNASNLYSIGIPYKESIN